ncbi:hypothetical protein KY361_07730 [Candidatus Woesearchaeota archaeon]|nr:hypothetical protein [Candidatus Woesearchaeota archaeon]
MPAQKSLQAVEGEGERKCPDCGSTDIIRESGELYCKKCGFVIDG